jgi:hypothetical protein
MDYFVGHPRDGNMGTLIGLIGGDASLDGCGTVTDMGDVWVLGY